jgi:hypothetical protein
LLVALTNKGEAMSKDSKHIRPLWQFVIGLALWIPGLYVESVVGGFMVIIGTILVLSAIGNAIVNRFKKNRA